MLTSYQNPVFDGYLADPFVLHYEGHYYAYGTSSLSPDGWAFPVLYSADLVHWQQHGWSLIPPGGDEFWAPEVAYRDGIFYCTIRRMELMGRITNCAWRPLHAHWDLSGMRNEY